MSLAQEPKFDRKEMNAAIRSFPKPFIQLKPQEQRVSVQIYRLLAQGKPVSAKLIAASLDLEPGVVNQILDSWSGTYYDAAGSIIGYWGLALQETKHRFEIDNHSLYTWCAWDSLFIPEIIGKTAKVTSTCPVTREQIRLTVAPHKIVAKPEHAVLSFIKPEAAKLQESVITNFCHYVHFFSSGKAGQHWVSEHHGTFLLSLDDAFALGHRINKLRYQDALC